MFFPIFCFVSALISLVLSLTCVIAFVREERKYPAFILVALAFLIFSVFLGLEGKRPTYYIYNNDTYIKVEDVVDILNDKECFIDSKEDRSNCKLIKVSWNGKSKKVYTILSNKIDKTAYKNKLKIEAIKE